MAPSPTLTSRAFTTDGTLARFVWDRWWPYVLPGLTKPSRRKYNSLLKMHVLPALGHLQIAEIGFDELQAMLDGMTRKDKLGGGLSASQRGEALHRAKEILEFHRKLKTARKEEAREDWKLVKAPPRPPKKKRAEPPADFTQTFLAGCRGYEVGPHFAALFLGLRRGEICGLTWDKIDRTKMAITVSEQVQPESGDSQVPVKGGEERVRTIPIPKELLEMIDELGDAESKYVFTAPRRGKGRHRKGFVAPIMRILPDTLSKWTPRICERLELPKVGLHDMRSHAASNLAALRVDPIVIMEILGHTDIDTSLLYINARNQVKRQALKKLLKALPKQQTDKSGDASATTG